MAAQELWMLLLLASCGAIGGFLSSTPLGVINLWVVNSAIDDADKVLKWFIIGVIAADVSYAAVAAWGYHQFLQEGNLGRWLEFAGGAFLIILGLANLRKVAASTDKTVENKPPTGKKPFRDFTLGVFMCGSNPAFLMFWVYAIKKVEEHFHITLTDQSICAFLAGIGLGDALWFKLITKVVRRGRSRVNTRALRYLSSGIAVAFVSFGILAVAKGFVTPSP